MKIKETYKTRGGKSITTATKPTPVNEWLEEGKRLYGPDPLNWKFRCPICGRVYTAKEHQEAGSSGPNSAYQECIGRYLGAGSFRKENGNANGCNWCAYGLLGTAGKGRLVESTDGIVVEVFRFADEEGGHHETDL